MKKLTLFMFLFFSFCLTNNTACAQGKNPVKQEIKSNDKLYELYPTKNIHNFIRLNTADGTMVLIQWSLKDKTEFIYPLNSEKLSYSNKVGRFKLYETNNNWTFLLLDTVDGRVFHVQWSFEQNERMVKEIL